MAKAIAVIDGDGQMPAEDVVRVHRLLVDEQLDLAKTHRVQRDDGAYRGLISTVYNGLFRILFPGMGLRDINSKPKVMTREAYHRLDLKSDGWVHRCGDHDPGPASGVPDPGDRDRVPQHRLASVFPSAPWPSWNFSPT